jgi:signal transduction histidine kinase
MRPLFLALATAGVALAVLAYEVQVDSFQSSHNRAIAQVVIGLAFLLAGVVAWSRRPANRLGALVVAAGFALLLRQLRYSHDALAFTVFFALGDLGYALVAHSVLAYPAGRVKGRAERWLVRIGYTAVLAFPLTILLLHDVRDPLVQFGSLRRKSDILVAREAHAAELVQKVYVVAFFGVLATAFILLIWRRLVLAAPRTRRMLAPLLLAAVWVGLRAVFECVFTFVDRPFASDYLFWWQAAAFFLLPVALLAGLLRARLARASVGDLVVELERTPPHGLRDALARGLGDPTLELAYWLPERRSFADGNGRPVELPEEKAGRAVTRLAHDGEPLAVLVHDPSLLDEPKLIEAAAAAARLALENARLSAELHSQLDKVKESRARIVAAADDERRRIERDIHDGAQQRLVALALELRSAQRRLTAADPELERTLASAVNELQVAVEELRELARGVHPAILTEEGLAAALESLVIRAPLPVTVETVPDERLAAEVEATAYFVACEGLANVVKHADASAATISARRRRGSLVVQIADDGAGGARLNGGGSGLRELADRVEALGGCLQIHDLPAGGTRIVAEIPCGS